jgi:hypothetical protein
MWPQVNPHSANYPTRSYITSLLNFNSLAEYTHLSAGGFFHDEPDCFQDLTLGVNNGMTERRELFLRHGVGLTAAESIEFHGEQVVLVSKLCSDFLSCSTPIIPGMCSLCLYLLNFAQFRFSSRCETHSSFKQIQKKFCDSECQRG